MSRGSSHQCSVRAGFSPSCCVFSLVSWASFTSSQQAGLAANVSKLLWGHSLLIRSVMGFKVYMISARRSTGLLTTSESPRVVVEKKPHLFT